MSALSLECGHCAHEWTDASRTVPERCPSCRSAIAIAQLGAAGIVDEEYEPGRPGRACLCCNSAWPTTEPDEALWHHASGCPNAVK